MYLVLTLLTWHSFKRKGILILGSGITAHSTLYCHCASRQIQLSTTYCNTIMLFSTVCAPPIEQYDERTDGRRSKIPGLHPVIQVKPKRKRHSKLVTVGFCIQLTVRGWTRELCDFSSGMPSHFHLFIWSAAREVRSINLLRLSIRQVLPHDCSLERMRAKTRLTTAIRCIAKLMHSHQYSVCRFALQGSSDDGVETYQRTSLCPVQI